jgi:hypothetical protein
MATMRDQTAERITNMILSGVLLSPLLALVKAISPLPIPWFAVFLPWISIFHLTLCCFAARIIARILWDLMHVRS